MSDDPTDPAQAAFIEAADEICRDMRRDIRNIETPTRFSELRKSDRLWKHEITSHLSALERLEKPAGDIDVLDRWLAQYHRYLLLIPRFYKAAEANDSAAYGRVAREEFEIQERLGQLAEAYGFHSCTFVPNVKPPPDDPEPGALDRRNP